MKKLLLLIALLFPVALTAQQQIASDDFSTYTCNGALNATTSGGNWTKTQGATDPYMVCGSPVTVYGRNSAALTIMTWSGAGTFSADQISQATISSVAASNYQGVTVRNGLYGLYCTTNAFYLWKNTGGTRTTIDSSGSGCAAGHTIGLKVTGQSPNIILTPLYDGGNAPGFATATYTDSDANNSGNPGITFYGNSTTAKLSNWIGSNAVNTAANPTFSPVAGTYASSQSVSISTSTGACSGYIRYTTNGTDPTAESSLYSSPVSVASTTTLKAKVINCPSYADSAVSSAAYTIIAQEPTYQVITDDRATYIDAHLTANGVAQLPLDPQYTNGKWITSRPTVALGSLNFAINTSRDGLSADQYARAGKADSSYFNGVCTRGATNGVRTAYCFTYLNSGKLSKFVNGAETVIATGTSSPIAPATPLTLRVTGTNPVVLVPLVNGATPAGMAASYNDSAADRIVSGSCGFAWAANVLWWEGETPTDFSCGNVGTPDATTAHVYTPTFSTYTDAPMSTSTWTMGWPWFQAVINSSPAPNNPYWSRAFAPYQVSGSLYALGLSAIGSGTISYRGGVFSANQWQRYKVGIEPTDGRVNNWFTPLQHQTWVPGTDGGCAAAGTSATCYDSVSIYPGVETFAYSIATQGNTDICSVKLEYACTPFMHITYVAPTSTDDAVLTGGGSFYTPRKGDELYVEFVSGITRVACKGNAANVVSWSANHAYSLNEFVVDSSGNWQRVKVAGTSSGSQPASWGTTWSASTAQGATTSDGTVTWEYFGHPCASSSAFTWVEGLSHVNLPAFTNQKGVPALWLGGNSGAPVFYDWSAGSVTATVNACALDTNLCDVSTGQPSWVIW